MLVGWRFVKSVDSTQRTGRGRRDISQGDQMYIVHIVDVHYQLRQDVCPAAAQ